MKRPTASTPAKAGPGFNTIRAGLKKQGQAAATASADEPQWLRVQKAIFGRFVEQRLCHAGIRVEIKDVLNDLASGVHLAKLVEVLSGEAYKNKVAEGLGRIQAISQISDILKWMESLKVDLKRCSPEDLLDKKDKAVFGMLFSVILKYVKLEDEDDVGGSDVREALKLWFVRRTHGYAGVEIKDLKASFYDGLALCALIHKMRPRLIPWETLAPGKDHATKNLELALQEGEDFCNVPKILLASDIPTLDEISMTVYLFDWYYGIATLQKQDVAARRLGKLVVMTKLHDGMRKQYQEGAQRTSGWIDSKVAWLNGITFNNTLQGIKDQMKGLADYKAVDKATEVAQNLDNDALFNNLAVRLAAAKRPAFAPAGLTPTDLDKKFEDLNKVERETSVKMQKELTRQMELDALHKRFKTKAKKLSAWVETESAYAKAAEEAALTDTAVSNLYNHSIHEKDVKNARSVRLSDLQESSKKLADENFEHKAAVLASQKEVDDAFAALEAALAAKKTVLDADLAREHKKDDAASKAFADLCEAFSTWTAGQKKEMQTAGAGKELEEQLTILDGQIASVKAEAAKVAAIKAAQDAVDAREVVSNPHTTVTVGDMAALHAQLTMLLNKKKELLQSQIEEKNKAGLSAEQLKEINDNFAFFDKNKSGSLDKKELRQCLASLGEDSTPADVDRVLNQYDTNKNGKIGADEFVAFMKKAMGDTNTEAEIMAGWKVITLVDEPKCVEPKLRVLVNDISWTDKHCDYLKTEQKDAPFPDEPEGLSYAVWTSAVFKR